MKLHMQEKHLCKLSNNEVNELVQHLTLTYSYDIPFTTTQLITNIRQRNFHLVFDSHLDGTVFEVYDPGIDDMVNSGTKEDLYGSYIYKNGALLSFSRSEKFINNLPVIKLIVLTQSGIDTATEVQSEREEIERQLAIENGDYYE